MDFIIKLYSTQKGEISRFLKSYFSKITDVNYNTLVWQKKYQNPLDIVDMIGTFIENNDIFKINMWISLDKDVFINVSDSTADELIRYIYERYPW